MSSGHRQRTPGPTNPAAVIGAALTFVVAGVMALASSILFSVRCDEGTTEQCIHRTGDYAQFVVAVIGMGAATWLLVAAVGGRLHAAGIAFGIAATAIVVWLGMFQGLV
jgi:hypothetical protein